jgi:exonuclease SbcD
MVKVLHLSDIHLGSGYTHGHLNPITGLNTRFEDFVATLAHCIDRAISEPVDLVLFGGDAFPDATPAPYLQQAFAQQFCRLVAAGIPTVLLVGNHDQHQQGAGGASLSIYRSLLVPNIIVGDTLATHRIHTAGGDVQVLTLPWLNRSTLMTRSETDGLSMTEVSAVLLDRLRTALEGEIRQLDPTLPAILLGHLMADTATYGAEKFLAVGKGFTVPLNLITRDCFSYIALGHVHKHQVLCKKPLTLYPGSIERVDFSEESEPKGFVLVEVDVEQASHEFCPVPARAFRTVEINLCESTVPQEDLLTAIHRAEIQDAVVRVIYHIRREQVDLVQDSGLNEALRSAHSYTISANLITQVSRSRLPELGIGSTITPLEALQAYLSNRDDLRDLEGPILQAAQALMRDEAQWIRPEMDLIPVPVTIAPLEESVQLRLI